MTDKLLSSIVFKSAIKEAFTLEIRPETLLHVRSMKINVMYRVDSILATKKTPTKQSKYRDCPIKYNVVENAFCPK